MFIANFVGFGLILQASFEYIFDIGDRSSFSSLCKFVTDESVESHSTGAEEGVVVDDAIVERVDFGLVNDLYGFRYVHR